MFRLIKWYERIEVLQRRVEEVNEKINRSERFNLN
jgi:hypothetical protein